MLLGYRNALAMRSAVIMEPEIQRRPSALLHSLLCIFILIDTTVDREEQTAVLWSEEDKNGLAVLSFSYILYGNCLIHRHKTWNRITKLDQKRGGSVL